MLSMRVWHLGLAFFGLAAAVSACSLALNWNQDGLPCQYEAASETYSCILGYTCALRNLNDPNDNLCIKDHSLAANANCQKDIQCETGLTCPSGTCLKACDPNNAYTVPTGCPLGQYCKPFYTTSGYVGSASPAVSLEGACVASDQCSVGNVCDPEGGTARSGTCLAVTANASACVLTCDVQFADFTLSSSFIPDCGARGNYNSTCEAVGPPGGEVTSCVTEFPAGLALGAPCNNSVSQPCGYGLTCWAGHCATWCPVPLSSGTTCPQANQFCCPTAIVNSQNVQLGYCVTGTTANCTPN